MLSQNRSHTRASGAAYRDFSRKRYAELKAQLANLRESEIVARVIREWEQMNPEQRLRYTNMKEEAKIPLNVEPLATPHKEKLSKAQQKTTGEKKTEKLQMREGSSLSLDDINVKEFDESSNSKSMKSKKISKPKSEYLSFFQHYFKKLHDEHPRWNPRQITTVIKLLWRKRKSSQKSTKMRPIRLAKPISGWKAFLKSNQTIGLSNDQGKRRWRRLPLESRMKWRSIGNPSMAARSSALSMRTTMSLSSKMSHNSMPSKLDFMQMRMM